MGHWLGQISTEAPVAEAEAEAAVRQQYARELASMPTERQPKAIRYLMALIFGSVPAMQGCDESNAQIATNQQAPGGAIVSQQEPRPTQPLHPVSHPGPGIDDAGSEPIAVAAGADAPPPPNHVGEDPGPRGTEWIPNPRVRGYRATLLEKLKGSRAEFTKFVGEDRAALINRHIANIFFDVDSYESENPRNVHSLNVLRRETTSNDVVIVIFETNGDEPPPGSSRPIENTYRNRWRGVVIYDPLQRGPTNGLGVLEATLINPGNYESRREMDDAINEFVRGGHDKY